MEFAFKLCRELCRAGEEMGFGVQPRETQGLQRHESFSRAVLPRCS